jgi:Leucine-rich repeat (LRR) protein
MDTLDVDWMVLDTGPGKFHILEGMELGIRVKNFDDGMFKTLTEELDGCPSLTMLNLSENRKITGRSLRLLHQFQSLWDLNLSACDIDNAATELLATLRNLERLNLSYCNRLTEPGLLRLRGLKDLRYLDLQGIPKLNTGIIARLRRPGLTIHR